MSFTDNENADVIVSCSPDPDAAFLSSPLTHKAVAGVSLSYMLK